MTHIYTTEMWYWENVKHLCVLEQLYTTGTNDEYETMLDFVKYNYPTPQNVVHVAADIADHSEQGYSVEIIANWIWNKVVQHFIKTLN